jgi:hypothetical protein
VQNGKKICRTYSKIFSNKKHLMYINHMIMNGMNLKGIMSILTTPGDAN